MKQWMEGNSIKAGVTIASDASGRCPDAHTLMRCSAKQTAQDVNEWKA